MGGASRLLVNFPSMAASNLSDLLRFGGSELSFIINPRAPDIYNSWGITGATCSNGNPGSVIVTGSWGGSFTNSSVILCGNWIGSVKASPAGFSCSPTCPRVSQGRTNRYLLHNRSQKRLWRQINHGNPRVRRRKHSIDFSDCPATKNICSIILLLE